jgi:hypothetical protein
MTRRATRLEDRLTEWGREYGGGKYGLHASIEGGTVVGATFGNSPLASLMKWHGRPPDGLGYDSTVTAADEVQEAYDALCKQVGGWTPAQVMRLEYTLPGLTIESRLQRLRAMGENVSRVRYYQHLRLARVHVAAWVKLPFSEPAKNEALV